LFVWLGAGQEASLVQMKSDLGGIPVGHARIKDFRTLSPHDPLSRAVELLSAGFQQDFPVLEDDRLVGVLTRAELLQGLAVKGPQASVAEVMQSQFQTADPLEMLQSVFPRLQACDCHTLPVVRDNHLEGLVTMENLGEFLMLQAAMRGARS
jgi:predicted transcriptional regulator